VRRWRKLDRADAEAAHLNDLQRFASPPANARPSVADAERLTFSQTPPCSVFGSPALLCLAASGGR
jgi:hypothetical protein